MADEHKHDEGGHGSGGGGHGGGHGGGGGHEEHEGAPEWLISFADNVMLQMGFFVILLALNLKPASGGQGEPNQPEQGGLPPAMLDGLLSIREAFNNPVDPQSDDPNEQTLVHRLREKQNQGAGASDEEAATPGREKETKSVRPSNYLGLGGKILFADGSTELDADGQNDIRVLCERLRGRRSIVEIRGHVSTAESYSRPDRGMHLSYERAWIVATALTDCGVSWSQLQLISAADTDRINATAYDVPAHRVNQRVEVIVSDRAPSTEEPPPPPAKPAGGP